MLKCENLESIMFNNNEVTSLEAFSKSNLPKLIQVIGINNRIAGALPTLNLANLKGLNLTKNMISSIDKFL